MNLHEILNKKEKLTKEELLFLMNLSDPQGLEKLYAAAYEVKAEYVKKKAYYRGLIEFSNRCIKDCFYCGIRKSNMDVERFDMTQEEILKMAKWAYENRYGSVTLQSGERQDKIFEEFITEIIKETKELSHGELGLTLCLGEQTEDTFRKWFAAGGHRYLLRIETTLVLNSYPSIPIKSPISINFLKIVLYSIPSSDEEISSLEI